MNDRILVLTASLCCLGSAAFGVTPCKIEVIDSQNDWPVPMVELTTNHGVRLVSDNNGVIAFDLPELMDTETWFEINGHGYEVRKDGFGYRGVRLRPLPGTNLTVKVDRTLPAKRLGRLTGAGIYAESQKCGLEMDWREQQILGCDTVQNVQHANKQFWLWGDTTLAGHPLGRFHSIAATTDRMRRVPTEPPVKFRYEYLSNRDGFPRNVAQMPGNGPTWCDGLASLPDLNGTQQLVATYRKIHPPLDEYERGLCVWNEKEQQFNRHRVVWSKNSSEPEPPASPYGHPVRWTDETGVEWLLFGDPWPTVRCRATFEDWTDPNAWEAIQAPKFATTAEHGRKIIPHRGSVAYSSYRQQWITIFTQLHGERSKLGEIWYAESKSPTGPWENAVHVATHDNYTFYNPMIHPQSLDKNSPVILFEGTFTHVFSEADHLTARYDYNQILYRLDLDELAKPTSPHGPTDPK